MKLQVDILNQGGGQFFLASGKTKPDKYRFVRVPGQSHIHRLEIQHDIEATLDDLALRLQQSDIPVRIRVLLEDTDLTGGDRIKELGDALELAKGEIERLREELAKPPVIPAAPASAPKPVDDETREMLRERDEMLTVLADFALPDSDETPLQVLIRLTQPVKEPELTKQPAEKPKRNRR